MSGLFIRLARHAVGQPRNLVRAASPMPYQQSSELTPTEQVYPQSEAASDAVAINSQSTAKPQSADELTPPPVIVARSDARTKASLVDKSDRLPPPDSSKQPGNGRIEVQPTVPDSAAGPPVPRRTADPLNQADDLAAVTASLENSDVFDHRQDQDAQTVAATSAMGKIFVETLVDNQPQNVGASRQQQTSPAGASPVEPGTPEPLLPSLATAPTANSVAAMQPPVATSEAPNEVHVHIGRIEVTALQSSEPPRRKAKAAQQPMSLDDYLARRREGRT